jgi:hypothetical protein
MPSGFAAGVLGRNAATVATMQANIDADLAAMPAVSAVWLRYVLINIGVNDFSAMPAEATWKASLAYILDAFHTKYASALLSVAIPWSSGNDARSDTMAGWIADVVATRTAFAAIGHDERSWFKPNVATYSYDGTHYTAAGNAAASTQWLISIGLVLD